MAGLPSIPPSANTPLPSVQGGHEGHGGAPGNIDNGVFSEALNQAIAQKANTPGAGHGAHGGQFPGMASNTASAHPNHFSVGQGGHAGHDFQQKMLGVRVYRQQLLASNIANADVDGYTVKTANQVSTVAASTGSGTAVASITASAAPAAPVTTGTPGFMIPAL